MTVAATSWELIEAEAEDDGDKSEEKDAVDEASMLVCNTSLLDLTALAEDEKVLKRELKETFSVKLSVTWLEDREDTDERDKDDELDEKAAEEEKDEELIEEEVTFVDLNLLPHSDFRYFVALSALLFGHVVEKHSTMFPESLEQTEDCWLRVY